MIPPLARLRRLGVMEVQAASRARAADPSFSEAAGAMTAACRCAFVAAASDQSGSRPHRTGRQVRSFGQRARHLTLRSIPTPASVPSFGGVAYNNVVPLAAPRRGRVLPQR